MAEVKLPGGKVLISSHASLNRKFGESFYSHTEHQSPRLFWTSKSRRLLPIFKSRRYLIKLVVTKVSCETWLRRLTKVSAHKIMNRPIKVQRFVKHRPIKVQRCIKVLLAKSLARLAVG